MLPSPEVMVAAPTPVSWTAFSPCTKSWHGASLLGAANKACSKLRLHSSTLAMASAVIVAMVGTGVVGKGAECRAHRTHIHGTPGTTSSVAQVLRICPQAEALGRRKRMAIPGVWGEESGYLDYPPAQPQIYLVILYKLTNLLSVQLTICKTAATIYCPYGAKQ